MILNQDSFLCQLDCFYCLQKRIKTVQLTQKTLDEAGEFFFLIGQSFKRSIDVIILRQGDRLAHMRAVVVSAVEFEFELHSVITTRLSVL